jgi:cation diffusion facilitator family transporter
MGCECTGVSAKTAQERSTIRAALILNVTMAVVGAMAGWLAQSTGILADALDMLTDAMAYALALMAITRGLVFKKNAARWSGAVLVVLGAGIVAEVTRRWYVGSEPIGPVMMGYAVASFSVNLYVLIRLAKFRRREVHLRASYICTRADVLANIAIFISGGLVAVTHLPLIDLIVGLALGLYVLKEAIEILRVANSAAAST